MTQARFLSELIRRYRQLWGGICWGIALFFAGFGGAYLIFGRTATSVPGAFVVLTEQLPGGIRTYGGILLFFGLVLGHGLANAAHRGDTMRDHYLHLALPIVAAVAFSAAALFGMSWVISGVKTWAGIAYWAGAGGFALLLWKLPPYPPDNARSA